MAEPTAAILAAPKAIGAIKAPSADALGGLFQTILNLGVPIVAGLVLAVGGLMFYFAARKGTIDIPWITKYPIRCEILRNRDGYLIPDVDYARLVKTKEGTDQYLFKTSRERVPAPNFSQIMPGNVAYLYNPNRGEYQPTSPKIGKVEKDGKITETVIYEPVMDLRVYQALATSLRDLNMHHNTETFWDKNKGVLSLLILGIMIVLLLYVTFQGMKPIAENLGSVGAACAKAAETTHALEAAKSVAAVAAP